MKVLQKHLCVKQLHFNHTMVILKPSSWTFPHASVLSSLISEDYRAGIFMADMLFNQYSIPTTLLT